MTCAAADRLKPLVRGLIDSDFSLVEQSTLLELTKKQVCRCDGPVCSAWTYELARGYVEAPTRTASDRSISQWLRRRLGWR